MALPLSRNKIIFIVLRFVALDYVKKFGKPIILGLIVAKINSVTHKTALVSIRDLSIFYAKLF